MTLYWHAACLATSFDWVASVRESTLFVIEHGKAAAPPCVAPSTLLGDDAIVGNAVLLEARRLMRRPIVVLNARQMLPAAWRVNVAVHADSAAAAEEDLRWFPPLREPMARGTVRVQPLPEGTLNVLNFSHSRDPGAQKLWYNRFLASPSFWSLFTEPWLLLFELDSAFCPNPTWPVGNFVADPHVFWGAPWAHTIASNSHGLVGGNSGLSLWHRETLLNFSAELHALARASRGFHIDGGIAALLMDKNMSARLTIPGIPPHGEGSDVFRGDDLQQHLHASGGTSTVQALGQPASSACLLQGAPEALPSRFTAASAGQHVSAGSGRED